MLQGYVILQATTRNVPVVQWIEYRIPVPTIRVRLPTGIPNISTDKDCCVTELSPYTD